ncbi:MAG: SsrA-binding protein [Candidatus Terrybacteria bacterium RIFCSPLOWO2_01_FULL_44_24]|uniref:SsrA-binding protein n=1 Tax=Candidatus Terrybacteria bacterium RIFCSPHIGHO2_01_FULL_43_35 TaxID=1802361 RepID=A0A1G2PE55_9BACT|nr:MAG: SsrA-binding protein [Candidatus Terrybacteria bacterium RIFCSPHIGHO2_01_FULL_43_35]OHA50852.1 MAG: SsrA-binding protein [Candidatus Terrybacteria bacterium RIFCSPLOWO2_01_FULL_44_24]
MTTLAENKRAGFDYEILEKMEAGIVLNGQETKSIRAGQASLGGAFVTVKNNELWLTNMNVAPWQPKNISHNYDEARPRKLLMHKNEIASLIGKIKTRGLTALPLRLYTHHGKIKVEIGVVKYRKKHDKRELIKKRDAQRDIARTLAE